MLAAAEHRLAAMQRHMWRQEMGQWFDLRWDTGERVSTGRNEEAYKIRTQVKKLHH